jgi:hypothetical protein
VIFMRSRIGGPLAASVLLTLLAGCAGPDEEPAGGSQKTTTASAGQPSDGGYGDILVGGRPVTGTKPSHNTKFPYRRTYTDGALYAPVTGYRSLAYGRSGLEAVYDSVLSEGADDVVTTIDPAVQKAAFTALGDEEGAAVALDVETGDLLAVVSTPSYDPGAFSGNLLKDQAAWRKTTGDSRKPMRNRAFVDATSPGGTFDVVIAAAALEHGLYSTVDEPTEDGGSGDCAGASVRRALADACGDVFAAMAEELGPDKVGETAKKLGFDDRPLFVPTRAVESTYENGYATATPLQMARVAAALADGGRLVAPRLVAEAEKPATRAVSGRTATSLLPAVRAAKGWVPAETADGGPLSWSLAYARRDDGSTVAIAVRVASADAQAATRVTRKVAEAVS